MKVLTALLVFRFEATGEQQFIYKNFDGLQLPCYAIN